jgi:hypothetical protein
MDDHSIAINKATSPMNFGAVALFISAVLAFILAFSFFIDFIAFVCAVVAFIAFVGCTHVCLQSAFVMMTIISHFCSDKNSWV